MTEVNRMEAVAQMRVQQWEQAVQQRKLLAEIAPPPTLWQWRVGRSIAWIGNRLIYFGDHIAQRACPQCPTLVGE